MNAARKVSGHWLVAALLFVLLAASNVFAQEQTDDNQFHGDIMPYMVVGGITGDMTIANRSFPVDQSASDLFSHLQFGLCRAAT